MKSYPHGVWFITLDSLSNPSLVPQTIASVFNVQEVSAHPIEETLINFLRKKKTLLILDNCEHLLEACAELTVNLLQQCLNLKVLATSREVLNATGEVNYHLPSLSLPKQNIDTLAQLTEYESIRLFAERAALAVPTYQLTQENSKAVMEICRRVDGIPLAIELAAARVDILQVEEILKQLNESFALLALDSPTLSLRHQTVQASMDWSWGLLNSSEQVFLQQLSVFAGGWTHEAAREVCDGDVLDLTNSLAKKSLIEVNQETGHETRYSFHMIVHQYASAKLSETGEDATIRTRHLNYILQLSKQAEPALKGPTQIEWSARLHKEWSNIQNALVWAEKTDVEAGLYICGRLKRFWENLDLREAEYWLKIFIEAPTSSNYLAARAKALLIFGEILIFTTDDVQLPQKTAKECLAIYRTLGDKQGEIDALILSGQSNYDVPQSEYLLRQALHLSKSIGDKWRVAYTLSHLAQVTTIIERKAYAKEAITLFRETGDLGLLETCLSLLAYSEVMNMEFESAQMHLDEVIQIGQTFEVKRDLFLNLTTLSLLEVAKGNFDKAQSLLEEVISAANEFGNRVNYLWGRVRLGHILIPQGKITEARGVLFETIQEFLKEENEIGIVFSLEGMASLYIVLGKHKAAAQLIGWSDAARKRNKDPRPPLEQTDVNRIISACQTSMSKSAFAVAYEEGKNLTMDEATELALGEN